MEVTTLDVERLIRVAGLRVTRSRSAVLEAVHGHPHAGVDMIVDAARRTLPDLSRQGVHDALRALGEAGLVRRFQLGSMVRFEPQNGDDHHHVVCTSCGRLADVKCVAGHSPCVSPVDTRDFLVTMVDVVYLGVCPDCAGRSNGRADRQGEPAVRAMQASTPTGQSPAPPAPQASQGQAPQDQPETEPSPASPGPQAPQGQAQQDHQPAAEPSPALAEPHGSVTVPVASAGNVSHQQPAQTVGAIPQPRTPETVARTPPPGSDGLPGATETRRHRHQADSGTPASPAGHRPATVIPTSWATRCHQQRPVGRRCAAKPGESLVATQTGAGVENLPRRTANAGDPAVGGTGRGGTSGPHSGASPGVGTDVNADKRQNVHVATPPNMPNVLESVDPQQPPLDLLATLSQLLTTVPTEADLAPQAGTDEPPQAAPAADAPTIPDAAPDLLPSGSNPTGADDAKASTPDPVTPGLAPSGPTTTHDGAADQRLDTVPTPPRRDRAALRNSWSSPATPSQTVPRTRHSGPQHRAPGPQDLHRDRAPQNRPTPDQQPTPERPGQRPEPRHATPSGDDRPLSGQ
ncbi:MAG: transcriptional repressor [Micrococcales bacterium]|nr:transcriptional repressor [Micrococcales bacterium]MCL2667884.1 transcriptional repressor [Micrococcales bacterium]